MFVCVGCLLLGGQLMRDTHETDVDSAELFSLCLHPPSCSVVFWVALLLKNVFWSVFWPRLVFPFSSQPWRFFTRWCQKFSDDFWRASLVSCVFFRLSSDLWNHVDRGVGTCATVPNWWRNLMEEWMSGAAVTWEQFLNQPHIHWLLLGVFCIYVHLVPSCECSLFFLSLVSKCNPCTITESPQ